MPRTFLDRFERIDNLIRTKATGNPDDFANKIGISRSMLYEYLSVLREKGAPIRYDKQRQSYYYTHYGKFKFFYDTSETEV